MDIGCQPEIDAVWDIEWHFTAAGSVAEGKCPGLSESSGNVPNLMHTYINITVLNGCSLDFRTSLQALLSKY